LWIACQQTKESVDLPTNDWLTESINHPGGKITEFWIHIILKLRTGDKDLNGLPQQYQRRFQEIILGHSYTSELGRVFLASQLYFLSSIDLSV
ncbi:hypothetical protein L0337_10545, partial [candidate division KSB1 bacterium]|nr:hypothetical protein [candidate division KSB1 bacterium]